MKKFKTQRLNDRKLEKANGDENAEEEAVIVVQSIKITDNFGFDKEGEHLTNNREMKNVEYDLEKVGLKGKKATTILNCLSSTTIGLLILVLVIIQIGFIVFWIYFKHAIQATKNTSRWWKENSFDSQIDSIRYSNTQYGSSPSSFYTSKPTAINRNQKI